MERTLVRTVLLAAVAGTAITLSACGSEDAATGAGSSSSAATGTSTDSGADTASAGPFGEGCAAVPTAAADASGSPRMADDPVATAAGDTPVLSTLVQAVRQANLVDALNTAEDVTVIAPVNSAFEAVPADALRAVLADDTRLTAVLTHHVIEGRLAPDRMAGTHTTLNGDEVTIEGSGEDLTVARTVTGTPASVLCGNVQTANATVYVVDQVLAPAAP